MTLTCSRLSLMLALLVVAGIAPESEGQTKRSGIAKTLPGVTTESGYSRYARRLEAKLDSALLTQTVLLEALQRLVPQFINGDEAQIRDVSLELGNESDRLSGVVGRLAGDFEVVTPPADFARLHDQIVEGMRNVAKLHALRARLLRTMVCEEERKFGQACNMGARMAEGGKMLGAMPTGYGALETSRARATEMLQEHGVRLRDLSASGTDTPKVTLPTASRKKTAREQTVELRRIDSLLSTPRRP